jgi:hypothetical protein
MWFDRLDVRDPLQQTDGVYGALARYYFLNNANVWAWALYRNDDPKGLESFPTDESHAEFGGRTQAPALGGETAVTYHHRYVDLGDVMLEDRPVVPDGPEDRLGIEGRWDIGIGLWFEASASALDMGPDRFWRKLATVGGDYTFESGIHVLCEHQVYTSGLAFDDSDFTRNLTALMVDRQVTLLDRIQALAYYDTDWPHVYFHVGWVRVYDDWSFSANVFSAPETGDPLFAGTGAQVLVTYNY